MRPAIQPVPCLIVRQGQPLIMIPGEEDGEEVAYCFADEEAADAAMANTSDKSLQDALSLAGAWSDLDWEEMEEELYWIRHANPPTPPIDDL